MLGMEDQKRRREKKKEHNMATTRHTMAMDTGLEAIRTQEYTCSLRICSIRNVVWILVAIVEFLLSKLVSPFICYIFFYLTFDKAAQYEPRYILGVDIDNKLILKAKRNIVVFNAAKKQKLKQSLTTSTITTITTTQPSENAVIDTPVTIMEITTQTLPPTPASATTEPTPATNAEATTTTDTPTPSSSEKPAELPVVVKPQSQPQTLRPTIDGCPYP